MLITPSEAVVGRHYRTAKSDIPVRYKGIAPKKRATEPDMYLLFSVETGNDITVGNDYLLSTVDASSELLRGQRPLGLDAFVGRPVSWIRENVGRLADADLEELARLDSRNGVSAAITTETLRRAEVRRELEQEAPAPKPSVDEAVGSEAPPVNHFPADVPMHPLNEGLAPGETESHPPGIDWAAPFGGSASITVGVPDGHVAGFAKPREVIDPEAPPTKVIEVTSPEHARQLQADGVLSSAAVVKVAEAFQPHGEPQPFGKPALTLEALADTSGAGLDAWRLTGGMARGEPLAPVDDGVSAAFPDDALIVDEPAPGTRAAEANEAFEVLAGRVALEHAPQPDGLEEVFGDKPDPLDRVNALRVRAEQALGSVVGGTILDHDKGRVILELDLPDGSTREASGATIDEAIAAARAYLEPVEPRRPRKRRAAAHPDSPPSPEVSELTRRIAELETANAQLLTQLRTGDETIAALQAERDRVTTELDGKIAWFSDEVNVHRARATEAANDAHILGRKLEAERDRADRLHETLYTLGSVLDEEVSDLLSDLGKEAAGRLRITFADMATVSSELRALKAAPPSTSAPWPVGLSPEGQEDARKVVSALRGYSDAYPWLVKARESAEVLRLVEGIGHLLPTVSGR